MNFQDFLEELKSNKECNFIAEAITVHQANSIDATIAFLESKGVKLNGYVLATAHKTTGKVVNAEKFVNNDKNIRIVDYESSYSLNSIKSRVFAKFGLIINTLFCKQSNSIDFYIASSQIHFVWVYWLNKVFGERNYKFVLLEDGDGSYANHFEDLLNFVKRDYNNVPSLRYYLAYVKFCLSYFLEYINIKCLEKKRNIINATIFLKEKKDGKTRLVRNECMSKHYQEVFKKFGSAIPKEKLKVFENSALINTQPLNANNITDGIIDFEIYRKTIEILNNLNISVVLKPHPRENDYKKYEKLDCQVFTDNTCSQEAILANLKRKPKCIISIFSSTLLNATGIYDIPAISLAKIIMKENINDVFVEQLNDFIERYKDLFFFPENYEELRDYLKNLKDEK